MITRVDMEVRVSARLPVSQSRKLICDTHPIKMVKSTQSQGKSQQSISSFFTKKTPAQASQDVALLSQTSPLPSRHVQNVQYHGADSDGDSSYSVNSSTTKRVLAEDTSSGNNGAKERPAKKARLDDEEQSSAFFGKGTTTRHATVTKAKLSPRTSKYLYNSPAERTSSQDTIIEGDEEEEDAAAIAAEKARKEELHRRFVKKLGHPDSLAQIRRRHWQSNEDTGALEDGDGDGEEGEEEPVPTRTKKKGAKTGKLTPMEIQFLDIKRKHVDTVLIVEVGYKFKFFGEDARVAAKELGIVCIPGKFRFDEHASEAHLDRFASASIPVHRLSVHAKRLVAAGHKIGVVRQIETAALKKAGDNRNTPFIRKLTNVYTKGTYIDDIEGLDHPSDVPTGGAPATGYLLCITETKAKGWGTDEKVEVGILAVQPATGDIIYDTFEDGFLRGEIETRLLHLAPCEILIVGELTKATDKLVQHLSGSSTNVFGDRIRVERVAKAKTMASEAYSHVTQFYANKLSLAQNNDREQTLLDKVLKLSEEVTICLSAMITHLTEYGLEHVFDLTKYFQSFSHRSHMLLNGNTLSSLEIYHNQTDHTTKGSLFWTIDRTQTRFGQRLLRKWIGRPLLDVTRLNERVAAVEELFENAQTQKVDKITYLLRNTKSDLERSLIRVYYGKCTRPELLNVLQTLQRISNEYASIKAASDAGFTSSVINEAIATLPLIGETIISFLERINAEAARTDDKYAFFREAFETEAIGDHKLGIAAVEAELDDHRQEAANILKRAKPVPYVTVAGIEYLIEIESSSLKHVPASWVKISGTKKLSRFHTPVVVKMLRERDQHKESLSAACDTAFTDLLGEISTHYALLRDAVSALATLDCLLSLATVANLPGYCKPTFLTSPHTIVNITNGRHPMVEQLLPTTYIPNSTALSTSPEDEVPKALLVTGANMGGKSSYVRQTALLCLLAQIGSYVPADALEITPLTSIQTRMGAYDSLFTNQSTFQTELSETSSILKSLPLLPSAHNISSQQQPSGAPTNLTPTSNNKTLLILDELGRGTSTHDGTAIASAVLSYIVADTTSTLCLFITHYQSLASLSRSFPSQLHNVHMSFSSSHQTISDITNNDAHSTGGIDELGEEEITFLYTLAPGTSHRSYGLNVARLARVPGSVLVKAREKSNEMEWDGRGKKIAALSRMLEDVIAEDGGKLIEMDDLLREIEQL